MIYCIDFGINYESRECNTMSKKNCQMGTCERRRWVQVMYLLVLARIVRCGVKLSMANLQYQAGKKISSKSKKSFALTFELNREYSGGTWYLRDFFDRLEEKSPLWLVAELVESQTKWGNTIEAVGKHSQTPSEKFSLYRGQSAASFSNGDREQSKAQNSVCSSFWLNNSFSW